MKTKRAAPSDPADDGDFPIVYRVRIWTPPSSSHASWYVDEWDVEDAEQITDVIDWARSLAHEKPFEVFIRACDHHTNATGQVIGRSRFALIFGYPADEDNRTETVEFEQG